MDRGKIIVTGGAGYIGSHTAVALVESGYEPVLIDDFSNAHPSVLDGLEGICGRRILCHDADCRDTDSLSRIFDEHTPIAGLLHFAASKAVVESMHRSLHYYSNNIGSLLSVIEVMLEHEVSDLVFSSSATVYGNVSGGAVHESLEVGEATSVYGTTKILCERILGDVVASGEKLRVANLRYFNPIGAHRSGLIGEAPPSEPQNLVPLMMDSAAGLRGPLEIFGRDWATPDGTCIRDYIHVMDVAEAHVKALGWIAEQPEPTLVDVFNVGTGRGRSVLEMIHAFESTTGHSLARIDSPRRPSDVREIYADVGKIENEFGWRAALSLEDAMRDAWRWRCRNEAHES